MNNIKYKQLYLISLDIEKLHNKGLLDDIYIDRCKIITNICINHFFKDIKYSEDMILYPIHDTWVLYKNFIINYKKMIYCYKGSDSDIIDRVLDGVFDIRFIKLYEKYWKYVTSMNTLKNEIDNIYNKITNIVIINGVMCYKFDNTNSIIVIYNNKPGIVYYKDHKQNITIVVDGLMCNIINGGMKYQIFKKIYYNLDDTILVVDNNEYIKKYS